jgi:hypothetical protein
MSTSTWSTVPANDTDVHFRAWGLAIATALQAWGITTTGDTGQIDWTAVTHPTTTTAAGYEIRQFTDALQTSNPIIMKIEYGGMQSAANPCLRIQFAHTSDGAGNLTGAHSALMLVATNAADATLGRTSYGSGDTGRFALGLWVYNAIGQSIGISVARTKDDTGADTADGLDIVTIGGAPGCKYQQYFPATGGPNPATAATNWICASPSTGFGTYAGNIGLYPLYPNQGYAGNPTMTGLAYFTSDISSAGTTIAVTMYGVSHTFLTLGTGVYASIGNNGNSALVSLAIRYD